MWNVLIADDEPAERGGIEMLLRRRNLPLHIRQAGDGEEAWEIIKSRR